MFTFFEEYIIIRIQNKPRKRNGGIKMLNVKKGDKVILKGFTGIKLGVFEIEKATDKTATIIKKDGKKMIFSLKTGKQTNMEEGKEKYANSIMEDDGSYVAPVRKKKDEKKATKKAEKKTSKKASKKNVEIDEDEYEDEEVEETPKKAKKPAKKAKKAKKEVEEVEDDEDFEDFDDEEE